MERYFVKWAQRNSAGWDSFSKGFETKRDAKLYAKQIRGRRDYAAIVVMDDQDRPVDMVAYEHE